MRDSFSHSYVCMYICMYVSIYRERVCVCKKQVDCLWKQICTYAICMYYVWIVCDRVCMYPAFFFFERTQTHTTHTLSTPAVAEYLPASQLEQVATEVAPTAVENFPASQLVQAAERVCAVKPENFPASQLVHWAEPAIYVHTLSHTTLCKFLRLYISRWPYCEHSLSKLLACMYACM